MKLPFRAKCSPIKDISQSCFVSWVITVHVSRATRAPHLPSARYDSCHIYWQVSIQVVHKFNAATLFRILSADNKFARASIKAALLKILKKKKKCFLRVIYLLRNREIKKEIEYKINLLPDLFFKSSLWFQAGFTTGRRMQISWQVFTIY